MKNEELWLTHYMPFKNIKKCHKNVVETFMSDLSIRKTTQSYGSSWQYVQFLDIFSVTHSTNLSREVLSYTLMQLITVQEYHSQCPEHKI